MFISAEEFSDALMKELASLVERDTKLMQDGINDPGQYRETVGHTKALKRIGLWLQEQRRDRNSK